MSSTFKSCSNVIMSSTNAPAMDFLCGPWGSYRCTPHRWFDYMGSTTNGFSPFDILYQYVDNSSSVPSTIEPFDPLTLKCNQSLNVSKDFVLIQLKILQLKIVHSKIPWRHTHSRLHTVFLGILKPSNHR